ncbi:glycosyltransferase family 2 protein [Roseobacter litoralis]|uniref:glycosyltransferase family 2 protein n=1 Tax=Roseobacter litoralis TaxID=42443 RepID=UPI0024910DAD|nr:glycosyltransferase family 2 protein [Roseobacter litoralis]
MTQQDAGNDLVVSIINYKTADLTIACVKSVLADFVSSPDLRGHIVVVDNASQDGSDTVIAQWLAQHPDVPVTLLRSDHNSGFSGGHNQGIAARQADFYLVLNSDAVLTDGFCKAMLAAAQARPDAGLFTPRIDYDDGRQQTSCFRIPSPASELIRGAATGPVTRALQRYNVWLDMPPAPDDIGWASFAGILLRGAMIDDIGPMDEGYFLYFEDTEYCLRARRGGWQIAYVPDARFIHFRGGSAPVKELARQKARLPRYYYASRTRLFYQAHGYPGLVAANLALYAGWSISGLRHMLGQKKRRVVAQEWRDIWTNLLTPMGDSYGPKRTT